MISFLYENELVKFDYIEGDYISQSWKKKLFYEIKLLKKIKSLKVNGTYIDVGSHHGNHSVYFDKFCNSDKVISIEGNPFNFEYLKKNISNNNCNNILHNLIISDKKDKKLYMKYDLLNTGNSKIINEDTVNEDENKNYISNKTTTLDDLLKDEINITLMKFDVEGHEYYALLGAVEIIEKFHPIIVIELHGSPYYKKIVQFLSERNYKSDRINYGLSPTYIYTYNE
jgi:hypothetical protein